MRYQFDALDMVREGIDWNNRTSKDVLQYAVGALLYTPAAHEQIGQMLCDKRYQALKAITLCLEDSIQNQRVDQAEEQLLSSLTQIKQALDQGTLQQEDLPLIFIRVRTPWQMETMFVRMQPLVHLVIGFVTPKFDSSNMRMYGEMLGKINREMTERPLYLMPILESSSVISLESRRSNLLAMKDYLDSIRQWILNIRVGGNDFCNVLGLRRNKHQTIYDIGVIQNVLMDILTVFGREYVVSGPVWEYFDNGMDQAWLNGLRKELELDLLNGFIGKTAVHPSQLLPIQQAMVVEEKDYLDALQILNWQDPVLGVKKGMMECRMNETKVHATWARKVMALANIYGVKRSIT